MQTVSRLGLPIDRANMVLDHGGTPTEVTLNQLNCGMGTFTLLDAGKASGLAKISTAPGFYYKPQVGEPAPQNFVDNASVVKNYNNLGIIIRPRSLAPHGWMSTM